MANKYIGDVTTSTPALTDFLVGVNGSDVYKALVSDVAKKIIEDYSGSTISGSAQSIQSAFSGANEIIGANNITGYNNRQGWIALTTGQNLNSVTAPGVYYATNAVAQTLINSPYYYGFKLIVEQSNQGGTNFRQLAYVTGWANGSQYKGQAAESIMWRKTINSGSTWSDWIDQPQRSEVNAIANRGGKNLVGNFPLSFVGAGVTFTRNDDGSITANGTSTGTSITTSAAVTLPAGTYILTGCPSGGSATTYRLGVAVGSSARGYDTGDGYTLTLTAESTVFLRPYVYSGAGEVTDLTFYPMLRDASIQDDTYVPYGMSNAEITSEIVDANTLYNATMESDYSSGSIRYVRFGRIVVFAGIFNMLGTETNGKVIATGLPTALVGNSKFVGANNSGGEGPVFYLSSGGELRVMGAYTLTGSARVSGAYISYN